MAKILSPTREVAAVLMIVTVAVACGPSSAERELAELAAVTAEKDSLLMQLTDNARLMSEISAELVRVKTTPAVDASSVEAPVEIDGDAILAGIRELTARVLDSEDRLLKTQQRLDALSRLNTQMASEFIEFEEAVSHFETTIANQKETIEALTDEVDRLRERNVQLTAEAAALTEVKLGLADSISAMEDRDNTVYYVIGTKDELLERGVIEEEGGSRVLFIFGRRGETIVPARDIDPAQFTSIDKRYVLDIPMPWADRAYRIVSRQDIASLATPPDENGEIRGVLRIADPQRFWQASRFLILVEG